MTIGGQLLIILVLSNPHSIASIRPIGLVLDAIASQVVGYGVTESVGAFLKSEAKRFKGLKV